ncbi:Arylsulfatase [Pirellulimonas nuda]|uniref:Arylsulfatase n=1 Tax=Pirellulimonas nuda TaxID=2528009 RepID=A0A518DE03_9BACT|nr:sulfatase-like hydrolase/transferase [Pirellulimonas nuda]QDU89708.1 Arylsulfatase [Pirellulimonas nuda]
MHKSLVLTLIAGLAWGAAPSLLDAAAPPEGGRPNIVMIYADDWGWGDLSCHGADWLATPNLDRIAREGIDFQQFNVLNPVCSPSRTALMTGMYPARFSVHQHFATPAQNHARGMPDWLDPQAPMLPRLLKQAGYRTGHFGKWHLTNAQTWGAPKPEAYGYDAAAVFNGGAGWGKPAALRDTAKDASAFIAENKDAPFFVNVWLHESHTPHAPTPEAMQRWKNLDQRRQVYAAVITDGDNAVGAILDALEAAGVADSTLVMFSSDNGPESSAANAGPASFDADAQVTGLDTYYSVGTTGGLRGRKRSLFEGGVRTPLLVRWPGHAPAGTTNDTTVLTAVDLLPTLCAAAGAELPAGYQGDGENLLAALRGEAPTRSRPVFWQWRGNQTEPDWWPRLAVRDGDWKLVLTDDAQRVELHRLSDDRAEATDVAAQHPEIVERLTKLALDWKATLPDKPNPACLTAAGPQESTPPTRRRRRAPAEAPAPSR